mgnify:FL=1
MSLVETIVAAAKPWADVYAASKPLSTTFTFAHIASLVVGGGLAIASDRSVLRAAGLGAEERPRFLHEFGTVHRPVIGALGVLVLSGLGMLLSDAETYLTSWILWTKLGLFAVLLANGYLVTRVERALEANPAPSNPMWGRFRTGALVSMALWLVITLFGVIVTSAS